MHETHSPPLILAGPYTWPVENGLHTLNVHVNCKSCRRKPLNARETTAARIQKHEGQKKVTLQEVRNSSKS